MLISITAIVAGAIIGIITICLLISSSKISREEERRNNK